MSSKADRIKQSKIPNRPVDPSLARRLPPGQMLTERFPILHEGEVPHYDLSHWNLRLFGNVEEEHVLSFQDIEKLPRTKLKCDIHCVTRWSKFDTEWEGFKFQELLRLVKLKPNVSHVMVHADYDYEANLPLEDLLSDDVLLATHYNGKPLTEKHGFPLRLVVPHLYFWKSAKWIRGLEFMSEDRPGYWERDGFHNTADPFKEQRFSGEDLQIPEDEWLKKEYD